MNVVMMGTGLFAEPTLDALLASPHRVVGLVTQPDRVVGQERGSTRQTGRGMKRIALEHFVPIYQPDSINTTEGIQTLRDWQPDLLVVAAYGQILSRDALAVTPHGGINVHASLLPKYRGAAPIAWAIHNGETRTGITIIHMTPALDAGDMLAQEAIDIQLDETAGELEARLAPLGARLVLQVIEQLAAGTTQGVKQDKSQATKAPKLTKEHGHIDWSRSPRDVRNHIRAMQPWPTAYTYWRRTGQPPLRVLVLRTGRIATMPPNPFAPPPGLIAPMPNDQELWVATGEGGLVEVLELQPAGKRRMTAEEFLRGRRPQPGDHFGPETP
jgi:methionyl-tRNA formyltransferase